MNPRVNTVCRLLRNLAKYVAVLIAIGIILAKCGVDTTALLTGVSILSVVVGLGANSLIGDMLSGSFIILEGEMQVGEIVTIQGYRGEILEIGVRTTKLKSHNGNIKIVNNKSMGDVINMTRNPSAAIVGIPIGNTEKFERVEEILNEELPKIGAKLPAFTRGPFLAGVSSMGDKSYEVTVVAFCSEQGRIFATMCLQREIKRVLDRYGVPTPVTEVVMGNTENTTRASSVYNADIK